MDAPPPLLVRGLTLFDDGEFFDAHEVIEELWQDYHGPERDLLKGIIQAAVALEHHRRGNLRGMRSVGGSAAALLRRYPSRVFGLEVAALARDLDVFLDAVERGESPSCPRIRRAAGAAPGEDAGGSPPRGAEENR